MADLNSSNIKQGWKQRAKQLKSQVAILFFASRDPRVPWYAKLFIVIVVGYALSPIDLIPDFIPVLGYLDDLILIPLGVAVAIKLIPPMVMDDARAKAQAVTKKPKNRIAAGIIIAIWVLVLVWIGSVAFSKFKG